MSVATKQALDDALAAHIADEQGESVIVTGYVLKASYASNESIHNGTTNYLTAYAEEQPFHVCMGLANMLSNQLNFEAVEGR